jgi:hypothetical protein
MTGDRDSVSVTGLVRELEISRPFFASQSDVARNKVLEDMCVSIRTVVKVCDLLVKLYFIFDVGPKATNGDIPNTVSVVIPSQLRLTRREGASDCS